MLWISPYSLYMKFIYISCSPCSTNRFSCSVNPCLDIGQVEGAFVQGMGYFLSEKVAYDSESGEQLTTNTWVRLLFVFDHCLLIINLYLVQNVNGFQRLLDTLIYTS